MTTIEGLKPVGSDMLPADPNVRVPDHVRTAALAAEAIHKQAYEQTPATPEPVTPATPEPVTPTTPAAVTPPAPEPTNDFTGPADQQSIQDSEWARRYNSMHGRWQAAQRQIGAMEQQMQELGQELVRTQNLVASMQSPHAAQPARSDTTHGNLITDEDRASYGDELIDLARRAARETITPEIEQLRTENQRLTQRVQSTGRRELFATLDGALPNWRAINTSVQFKSWLRLPNVYTGQVRGQMLKAAVDGAEAPKVIALFKDFLAEAQATGQQVPAPQIEQQPQPAAPRTPAVALDTLTAPGRAKPASGDSQMPADKPIYSRAQISKFYDDKRRGLYAGRQADADAFEADLTAAQREGRIRG